MTVLDHARKLVADCDEELHFERRVKRALKCLIAEIERLESELESIGAGGVGPLMPVANSPEIPDNSDHIEQQLDMVPVAEIRNGVLRWYFSSPQASTPKRLLRGVHPLYTRHQPQERSHGIGSEA